MRSKYYEIFFIRIEKKETREREHEKSQKN